MSTHPCTCKEPVPVTLGDGSRACWGCGGWLPQKEREAAVISDTMTPEQVAAEVKQIRRIIHGLNNRLEKLDDALNTN
jgi:hypothetical protein